MVEVVRPGDDPDHPLNQTLVIRFRVDDWYEELMVSDSIGLVMDLELMSVVIERIINTVVIHERESEVQA